MPATTLTPSDPRAIGPFALRGRLTSHDGMVDYLAVAADGSGREVVVRTVDPDPRAAAARAEVAEVVGTQARAASEVAAGAPAVEGLARLVAADPAADVPWLATEHVVGRPVLTAAAHVGLAPRDVPGVARRLAEILADLHATGFALRSVAPGHVVLTDDGVRLTDLGQARRVGSAAPFPADGSPEWGSPELLDPLRDPRPRDVHGWGTVVAYAATGRAPFGTGAGADDRMRVAAPDVGPLEDPLRGVVLAALDPIPTRRPTAAAVLAALDGGGTQTLAPVATGGRDRARGAVAVLAMCAVLAAGGAAVLGGRATQDGGAATDPGALALPEDVGSATTEGPTTTTAASSTPAVGAGEPGPSTSSIAASPAAARTAVGREAGTVPGSTAPGADPIVEPVEPVVQVPSTDVPPGTAPAAPSPTVPPVPSAPAPSPVPTAPESPSPTATQPAPAPSPTASHPGRGHGRGKDKPRSR